MLQNDQILLERWVREQDGEAFKALVSRYSGMVYAACRRVLDNATDAEDIAQECFEALAVAGTKPGPYLGAWLHRVATNHSLNHLRARVRQTRREERFSETQPRHCEIQWKDIHEFVDEAVEELPDKYRIPLIARYLEDRSCESVAQMLGVSRQLVTYRINKGVERVRGSLKRKGAYLAGGVLVELLEENAVEAAPVTLVAKLGKVALAGPQVAVPAAVLGALSMPATTMLALGKAAAALFAAVLLVAGSWWAYSSLREPAPPAPVAQANVSSPVQEALESPSQQPGPDNTSVPATPEKREPGFYGHVTNGRGEAVSDVSIEVFGNPPDAPAGDPARSIARKVASNQEGAYSVPGLEPWKYDFVVKHTDYSDWYAAQVSLTARDFNIVMPDLGMLEGRVVDADTNQPIPEFEMAVLPQGMPRERWPGFAKWVSSRDEDEKYESHYSQVEFAWRFLDGEPLEHLKYYRQIRDDAGRFSFDRVKAQKTVLVVRAPNHVTTGKAIGRIHPGERRTDMEVALAPECIVEGLVLDAKRNPIEGAVPFADTLPNLPPQFSLDGVVKSDAAGSFRMLKLEKVPAVVYAWKPGYAPGRTELPQRNHKQERVEIVLTAGGAVEGVVMVGNRPVEGAGVALGPIGERFTTYARATTGPEGLYRLENIMPDAWRLQVNIDPYEAKGFSPRTATQRVSVEENGTTRCNFTFASGNASIEGYVTANGKACTCPATIEVSAGDFTVSRTWLETDAHGFYHIDDLPPGPLALRVLAQGNYHGTHIVVTANALPDHTIRRDIDILKSVLIMGRVKGVPEMPDTETRVLLIPGNVAFASLAVDNLIATLAPLAMAETEVDSDGSWTIDMPRPEGSIGDQSFGPGAYTVVALTTSKDATDADAAPVLVAFGTTVFDAQEGENNSIKIALHKETNSGPG